MKILLTGGCGFVGCNLAADALKQMGLAPLLFLKLSPTSDVSQRAHSGYENR